MLVIIDPLTRQKKTAAYSARPCNQLIRGTQKTFPPHQTGCLIVLAITLGQVSSSLGYLMVPIPLNYSIMLHPLTFYSFSSRAFT